MKLIAFNGYTFSVGGYSAGLPDGQNIGNFGMNPNVLPRRAASALLTGATIGSRTITADFGYDGTTGALTYEDAFQKLIGILDPINDQPRTLTAQLNDGTTVECQAIVIAPNATFGDEQATNITISFFTTDPFWRELTDNTTTIACTGATSIAIANNGRSRAYPFFKIGWSVQRTTNTSSVGWKWRRQVTITNDSAEDWHHQPVCIDLGDTAAWVTGSKAQADGDDVRIRYQGSEFNRTLTNFNTKRTLCHFLVSIKAGASNTYDVIYGNPSAGTARDMSTRGGSLETYIAFDLGGDSGTLTSGSTTTATDTGATWETDQWAGGFIGFMSGTGSVRYRRIASNTSTTITLNRALGTAVDNTTTYIIWKSGIFVDGGRVTAKTASTITDNLHTVGWGINQLIGATVTFLTGSAAPATMTVQSNSDTALTFTGSFSVQPAVNDTYQIDRYGVWSYSVKTAVTETNHRGVYRVNNFYSPAERIWPGELTPAGWGPDTYLDNSDDFRQLRPQDIGASGGHNVNIFALPRASRRVRQAGLYKDEGSGDGMSTYSPFGFTGIYYDKKVKNINGVGKVVLAGKQSSGEDWADYDTYTTTQASLTAIAAGYINLYIYNNPTRIGLFVAPADGVEIPQTYTESGTATGVSGTTTTDSSKSWATNYWKGQRVVFDSASTAAPKSMTVASNTGTVLTFTTTFTANPTVGDVFNLSRTTPLTDEVEVRTNDILILTLFLGSFGDLTASIYSVGSEVAVYDANMILRLGGGADGAELPPYDRIVVGGSGHRLHLIATEELWIRTDPASDEQFAAVYTTADVLAYRCPWAVRPYHHEADIDGADTALIAREIMPIQPGNNLLTNPTFATNTTGWTLSTVSGTVTWTRDAAVFEDSAGALKAALANNSIGRAKSTAFTTVVGETYDVAFWWRTDDISVDDISFLGISPHYIDTTTATRHNAYGVTIYGSGYIANESASDTWWTAGYSFVAADTSYSIGFDAKNAIGGASNLWIDAIVVGPPNLYISETSMGTIYVETNVREGYSG